MSAEQKFQSIFKLLLNLFIGTGLTLYMQLSTNSFGFMAFVQELIVSIGIGYTIGDWIPVRAIGQGFANLLKCKKGIANYLVSTFAISVVMVSVIGFFICLIKGGTAVFFLWISIIPGLLPVGIIVIELALAPCMKLAMKLSGFEANL